MPRAGPSLQSADARPNHKCRAPCRARLAICPRTESPELRALRHRRTLEEFPLLSACILTQRNAKSTASAVEKIILSGEEKEIPAIKRTVWTIAENLAARRGHVLRRGSGGVLF